MRYYVGRSVDATADAVWEAFEKSGKSSPVGDNGEQQRDPLGDTTNKMNGDEAKEPADAS